MDQVVLHLVRHLTLPMVRCSLILILLCHLLLVLTMMGSLLWSHIIARLLVVLLLLMRHAWLTIGHQVIVMVSILMLLLLLLRLRIIIHLLIAWVHLLGRSETATTHHIVLLSSHFL